MRIRAFAWEGDVAQCGIEADHLHNIPEILCTHKPELLSHYMDTTRVVFMQCSRATYDEFKPLWEQLSEGCKGEDVIPDIGRATGQDS